LKTEGVSRKKGIIFERRVKPVLGGIGLVNGGGKNAGGGSGGREPGAGPGGEPGGSGAGGPALDGFRQKNL